MSRFLARRKQTDEELRILINLDRPSGAVVRSNQSQLPTLLRFRKTFLLVARFQPLLRGRNPDLQQVRRLRRRRIVLAVPNSSSCGHPLSVARPDHGSRPQAVLMLELTREDVSDDLHVAVRVRRETAIGPNRILVDNAQRAEPHPLVVPVIAKTKGMAGLEPAVVAAPAFITTPDGNHDLPLQVSRCNDHFHFFGCQRARKDSRADFLGVTTGRARERPGRRRSYADG
jgi:hypothetical protein